MRVKRTPQGRRVGTLAVALTAAALLLVGCSQAPAASPQLLEVRSAAAESSEVDGEIGEVDCWNLGQHIVDAQKDPDVFRVICRVHYDQQGTARWRDMTCIGDLEGRPVLEYCYPWLPYDGVPTFEDGA